MSGRNSNSRLGALGDADPLPNAGEVKQRFFAEHERAYGFHNPADPDRDRELPPDRGRGQIAPARHTAGRSAPERLGPQAASHRAVWFAPDAAQDTPVYDRASLLPGDTIAGPAVIEQLELTTLLFPGDRATVDPYLNLTVEILMSIDPITLEIIWNGLKSIKDETFIALMKSAYSTNIKERHDHSTAIIDRAGRLIVQAEMSLPIHLASMPGLMQTLLAKIPRGCAEGDMFIANDPMSAGGTHLPDINFAMPVFADGELVGFICNIAHHADIGGITPGSMAGGTEIYQEGMRIPVIRLFRARRTAERHARPAAAQRAYSGGAARRLFRAGRGLPAGRAARRRDDRAAACRCSRGVRRDHPAHPRAHAEALSASRRANTRSRT